MSVLTTEQQLLHFRDPCSTSKMSKIYLSIYTSTPSLLSIMRRDARESLRLRFRFLVQRYVFKHASVQLLVNSFNGPSRMFFPFAKFKI